jgi:ribosome production factor 1
MKTSMRNTCSCYRIAEIPIAIQASCQILSCSTIEAAHSSYKRYEFLFLYEQAMNTKRHRINTLFNSGLCVSSMKQRDLKVQKHLQQKKDKKYTKKGKKLNSKRGKNSYKSAEASKKGVTRTIESMREFNDSIVPNFDEEIYEEEMFDEFSGLLTDPTHQKNPHTRNSVDSDSESDESASRPVPKIAMMVGSEHPSKRTYDFLKEFTEVVPNSHYFKKKTFSVKKVSKILFEKGFTCLFVIQEHNKAPDSLLIVNLPEGPSSQYKLTNLRLGSELKNSATCNTEHNPEIILKNFSTRLGFRVKRQLQSIFPVKSDEHGRRVITFHNQRDFIFFRHYRYIFKEDGDQHQTPDHDDDHDNDDYDSEMIDGHPKSSGNEKIRCPLQEIGPRFTLKLHSMQVGEFDRKNGQYEFMWRPDTQISRKAFAL